MTRSEREKMAAGEWYTCLDEELDELRKQARRAVHQHNTMPPDERRSAGPYLVQLFQSIAEDAYLEAPFHCAYGFNITLGRSVYLNAGCVILDTAPVIIGDQTMLGPNVQIYCAQHHKDRKLRSEGLEIAKPVRIGREVWIGGSAIIMPGVTIGDSAIVAAGAVVTRDVAADTTVLGNPARPR